MKQANDILQGILTVLTRIENNTKGGMSTRVPQPSQGPKAKAGVGSIANRIKVAVTPNKIINKIKAAVTPNKRKTSGSANFITELISNKNFDKKKVGVISSNIVTIADALPDLARGIKDLEKINPRKANRGINVLNNLFTSFDKLGRPITNRNVARSVKTLTRMGRALMRVARPLKMMSNFLLKLALGIVAFAGALFLSSKILKVTGSPLKILGIIALTVVGMIGAFALLGLARRPVRRGAKTIKSMGVALALLSLGLLAFSITLVATSAILGTGGGMSGVLKSLGIMALVIAGTAGLFFLIGKGAVPIILGSVVAIVMTAGMVALSFGIMALVGAAKGISMMANADNAESVSQGNKDKMSIIGGLGVMGVIILASAGLFALLGSGIVSGLVALGVVVSLGMTVGMIGLAMAVKKLVSISGALQGKNVQGNISDLISGVFIGFTEGISLGLMGKSTTDPSFWQKAGMMAKNTALLMGGVVLISGVAVSLSLFALSLKAFQKVGNIRPIIGGTKENPTFGPPVSVLDISKNIASSLLIFFTTLNDLFQPGGGMPSEENMQKMTSMLMGKSGLRLFGFDIARNEPNMMDALMKFGSTLKFWSEFGEHIPIGTDAQGNPIKGVSVTKTAQNIGDALSGFMRNMVSVFDANGRMPSLGEIGRIVNILTGESGLKVFGINVTGGPNLMDALMKFGSTLKFWGQFGEAGEIPMGTDEAGNPIKGVKLTKVANNIAEAVRGFMTSLTTEIPNIGKELQPQIARMARILLGEKTTGYLGLAKWLIGIPDAPGILEPVSKFADVIQQFAAGQIQTGEYDTDGNPIWKPINYGQTAKNIVSAISGFTTELSKGLGSLTADSNYASNAENAANYIGKFETLFEKLQTLSSSSSGLEKLALSLTNVGSGLGTMADNLERMDTQKLNTIINSDVVKATSANVAIEQQKSSTTESANWDDISAQIGVTVGQEVSKALKRGQFKFEFDNSGTGGVYYFEPS